jgi:prepilin-type processing-associated H-X9-DG protein
MRSQEYGAATVNDLNSDRAVTRIQYNKFYGINHRLSPYQNFGSWHAGGAHFLLGDGSVRFISENVDGFVYQYLGSIADGQVIGEF